LNDLGQVPWIIESGESGNRKAVAGEKVLLNEAILNTPQNTARGPHGHFPLKLFAEWGWNVLPLVGHNGHRRRKLPECSLIRERPRKRMGCQTVRRSVGIRIPDCNAIAVFLGRTREKCAELAAAEDAEYGSGFDY
jgi:hypothetical protein